MELEFNKMKNENKESKLIKKIWNGADFLVPGSMFFRLENWKENPGFAYLKILTNMSIICGLLGMGFLYVTNAVKYESLNYKKWPEIRKEIQIRDSYENKIKRQMQCSYENQLHELEFAIGSSDEVAFSNNLFKKFDMDKDRKISIKEFREKYPKFNYKNSAPFGDYNSNKDNFIDSSEFVQAFTKDERAYPYLFWKD